jgi:hypothetical protein
MKRNQSSEDLVFSQVKLVLFMCGYLLTNICNVTLMLAENMIRSCDKHMFTCLCSMGCFCCPIHIIFFTEYESFYDKKRVYDPEG